MNKWQEILQKHRKFVCTIVFMLMILFSCTTFPFFNFTHEWSKTIRYMNIFITWTAFWVMGTAEAEVLRDKSSLTVLVLNLFLVLAGMGARYLLEYGEISNVYNFTMLNSIVHIFIATLVSTASWGTSVAKLRQKGE